MVHGGAKYSTDNAICSTEVLKIPRTMPNVPWRCQIFHGQCEMFHIGAKYSTQNAKRSKDVLNIPRRGLNVPRRC